MNQFTEHEIEAAERRRDEIRDAKWEAEYAKSDTPETDAEWERKDLWRPIYLANAMKAKCENLERERDEARRLAEEWKEYALSRSADTPKLIFLPWEK
jgi:hypothetical protein